MDVLRIIFDLLVIVANVALITAILMDHKK